MTAPSEVIQHDSLARDVRRGLKGEARQVADLLYAFAKSARSFGFYDRDNRAIAMFLDELFSTSERALAEMGAIRLVVGADRFVWKGDAVYIDPDREKGLPFRLFRDGIRGLIFKPGLTREDILALLDVLSRRQSVGKAAEEEDVVTLLWKLSLKGVSYEAVEGFTHELHGATERGVGEDGTERQRADSGQAIPKMLDRISGAQETIYERMRGRAARSFADSASEDLVDGALTSLGPKTEARRRDPTQTPMRESSVTAQFEAIPEGVPLPALKPGLYPGSPHYPLGLRGGLVEVRYDPLGFEEVESLRRELADEERVGVLHLLDYCFELCQQESEFFSADDFAPMIPAIRRYLLRGRDLETYDGMLRYLARIAQGGVYPGPAAGRSAEMLRECASSEALAALVATASGDDRREGLAWNVMQVLLPDLQPTDVLNLLGHQMSERLANIVAASLIRKTKGDLAPYAEALAGSDVPSALAALRCLAILRTPEAVAQVETASRVADPTVRRAATRILGVVPMGEGTPASLVKALRDEDEAVWREALVAIEQQGGAVFADSLCRWLDDVGWKRLDEDGRNAVALLAADLDPDRATAFFAKKLQMKLVARMGTMRGGHDVIDWNRVAVVALAAAGTREALEKLREVRAQGDDAFREHVGRSLIAARKRRQG